MVSVLGQQIPAWTQTVFPARNEAHTSWECFLTSLMQPRWHELAHVLVLTQAFYSQAQQQPCAWTINEPHLPYKTGLDVMQSHPLRRARFGQYQALGDPTHLPLSHPFSSSACRSLGDPTTLPLSHPFSSRTCRPLDDPTTSPCPSLSPHVHVALWMTPPPPPVPAFLLTCMSPFIALCSMMQLKFHYRV